MTATSQQLAALERALEVRDARCRLHRRFQALTTEKALRLAVQLLRDRDEDTMTLRLTQLIGWIPALGRDARHPPRSQIADQIFEDLGVTVFDRKVGELSPRQIAGLVVWFERLAGVR